MLQACPPGKLAADALECVRGNRRLFHHVTMEVEAGTCLVVQGANGSGKTSLLRILTGLSKPSAGEVYWNGTPIQALGDEYRNELLYCGHKDALKDELTVEENLVGTMALAGRAIGVGQLDNTLVQAGLAGLKDLPARLLSQGQRRRVSLARLLVDNRRIWILDEPLTALDTRAIEWVFHLIGLHIAQGGLAVIASHHDIPLARSVRYLQLPA